MIGGPIKSAAEMLARLDAAGIPYRSVSMLGGKLQAWAIEVPDDNDAAFAFRMFVQP